MKLVPVLEFEAGRFQTKAHVSPNRSRLESPDEWEKYWQDSLADKGIIGLASYERGSSFVPVAALLEKIDYLKILLSIELSDFEYYEDIPIIEMFSALDGGYCLELNSKTVVQPQCCGSLENISEWKQASVMVNPLEKMLWIGHPWLMVRSLNELEIQLRRIAEYGEPEEPTELVLVKTDLKQAVEDAEQELAQLHNQIRNVLAETLPLKLSPEDLDIASKVLVYGHGQAQ